MVVANSRNNLQCYIKPEYVLNIAMCFELKSKHCSIVILFLRNFFAGHSLVFHISSRQAERLFFLVSVCVLGCIQIPCVRSVGGWDFHPVLYSRVLQFCPLWACTDNFLSSFCYFKIYKRMWPGAGYLKKKLHPSDKESKGIFSLTSHLVASLSISCANNILPFNLGLKKNNEKTEKL